MNITAVTCVFLDLTFLAFIVAAGLSEANRKIDGSGK